MTSERLVATVPEVQDLLRDSHRVQQAFPKARSADAGAAVSDDPFVAFLTCPGDPTDPWALFGLRSEEAYWMQASFNECGADVAASAEWALKQWGVPLLVVLAHQATCRFSPGACGLKAARKAVADLRFLLGMDRGLAIVVARRNGAGLMELDGPAPPDLAALQMCKSRKAGVERPVGAR
ncbi:MAG: hypothetical protein GC160_12575 [Acidobacteria bacterium]|nr:hypothetical protein [Acidobacteriota bacterium]